MKLYYAIFTFVALLGQSAFAQDFSKTDLFLGYSFLRVNPAQDVKTFMSNGGVAALAYNFNNDIALEAEFGGYHNSNVNRIKLDATSLHYLFGPRWSVGGRSRKYTPYLHALWGATHFATSVLAPSQLPGEQAPALLRGSQTSLAMVVGGGIDIRLNERFVLRPAQLDYFLTTFSTPDLFFINTGVTPGVPFSAKEQSNFRFAAGIVFTFGAR